MSVSSTQQRQWSCPHCGRVVGVPEGGRPARKLVCLACGTTFRPAEAVYLGEVTAAVADESGAEGATGAAPTPPAAPDPPPSLDDLMDLVVPTPAEQLARALEGSAAPGWGAPVAMLPPPPPRPAPRLPRPEPYLPAYKPLDRSRWAVFAAGLAAGTTAALVTVAVVLTAQDHPTAADPRSGPRPVVPAGRVVLPIQPPAEMTANAPPPGGPAEAEAALHPAPGEAAAVPEEAGAPN